MDIDQIVATESKLIKSIKRNCTFSIGRKNLRRETDPEKAQVGKELQELYNLYKEKYDLLRKNDADGAEIQTALDAKRKILDTIDLFKGNAEMDLIYNKINSL
ncbi:MAG: hypothetical protein COV47_05935 [Candidatus Diapherotrites archaeon CG11_big_fil_rev_8_21_14_0_20_37_9]|nr:MAG: hypothetical protein COV47_05935 [Candidatus Diapherotrites archaeon CG11_big_fil_rev_8_21_14_0_20_37_9]